MAKDTGHDPDNDGLPLLPRFRRDELRPNPHSAIQARGPLAFAQGSSMVADFGQGEDPQGLYCPDTSAGGARVRPALGLPKRATAESKPDDTARGWL